MLKGFDERDGGDRRDLVFIPVGINYDRVLEDRSLLVRADGQRARVPLGHKIRVLASWLGRQLVLRVQGQDWTCHERAVVLLHKPAGYECSRKPLHHPSVLSLLPPPLRAHIGQHVEDLLLSRPDLAPGFTSSHADGHGSSVALVEPGELVAGHSPRTRIQMVGSEDAMRIVLSLIRGELPRANMFFWLVPVIEMGRL